LDGRGLQATGASPPAQAALGEASLTELLDRPRVVGRILAPGQRSTVVLPSIVAEVRAATRAAALLGEQRFEWRDGVDLAAT
jgi:hypothetical protein